MLCFWRCVSAVVAEPDLDLQWGPEKTPREPRFEGKREGWSADGCQESHVKVRAEWWRHWWNRLPGRCSIDSDDWWSWWHSPWPSARTAAVIIRVLATTASVDFQSHHRTVHSGCAVTHSVPQWTWQTEIPAVHKFTPAAGWLTAAVRVFWLEGFLWTERLRIHLYHQADWKSTLQPSASSIWHHSLLLPFFLHFISHLCTFLHTTPPHTHLSSTRKSFLLLRLLIFLCRLSAH